MLEILREELDQARAQHAMAKETFWHISAAPASKSDNQQIIAAARAQTNAMNAYTRALRRLNEFLIEGIIPEDIESQVLVSGKDGRA